MKFKVNPSLYIHCDSLLYLCVEEEGIAEPILESKQAHVLYALTEMKDFTYVEASEKLHLSLRKSKSLLNTLVSHSVIVQANTLDVEGKKNSAFRLTSLKKMLSGKPHVTHRQLQDSNHTGLCTIIDNFFCPWVNESVHKWLLKLAFRKMDVDNPDTIEHKHWVFYLSPPSLHIDTLPFLRFINQHILKNYDLEDCYLTRSHIYAGSFEDVYFPHRDSESSSAITVIYYPSPWLEEWGGELLFYQDGEVKEAIGLKSGRLVIFPGCLTHRIGAISAVAKLPRYSIVLRYDG